MTIAKLIVGSLSGLLLAIPGSGTNQQPYHPREYSQTQEGRSIWIQRFGWQSEAIPQMLGGSHFGKDTRFLTKFLPPQPCLSKGGARIQPGFLPFSGCSPNASPLQQIFDLANTP